MSRPMSREDGSPCRGPALGQRPSIDDMTQTPQTEQHDWPTQLRFPGQVAAPAGPVDMSIMYVLHYGLRRDLRRFAETVPHTPVADTDAWRRLAARWTLFAD